MIEKIKQILLEGGPLTQERALAIGFVISVLSRVKLSELTEDEAQTLRKLIKPKD